MPTPTQENAQRINELSERLKELGGTVETRFGVASVTLDILKQQIADLTSELNKLKDGQKALEVADGRIEERLKALEKGTDRTWQLAPLVISAIAILVSLIVAFVKK